MSLNNSVSNSLKQRQSYGNTRAGNGKEQYYTNQPVAARCVQYAFDYFNKQGISVSTVLEPCGGTGKFVEELRSQPCTVISCDIDPKHPDVAMADFLDKGSDPVFKNGRKLSSYQGLVCITNPPFGRNNNLAIGFFKRMSEMSDYICIIVPKSWRKRSIINKLPEDFHLVADYELPSDSYHFEDGTKCDKGLLKTVFQIWKRGSTPRPKICEPDHGLIKKIRPDSSGMVTGANVSIYYSGSTTGKVTRLDGPVEANTASYYFDVHHPAVIEEMEKIDYQEITNNAYVPSFSLQELNRELNKAFGLETQDLSWLEKIIGS